MSWALKIKRERKKKKTVKMFQKGTVKILFPRRH